MIWSRIRVDWRTGGRDDLLKFSDHFAERLILIDTAAREWMGLVAYWITGKTSEFRSKRTAIPCPAADRPIKPPIAGLRDPQRSFDLVDATQVLIDP